MEPTLDTHLDVSVLKGMMMNRHHSEFPRRWFSTCRKKGATRAKDEA